MEGGVPFPPELLPVMPLVEVRPARQRGAMHARCAPCSPLRAPHSQQYVQARLEKFVFAFARRLAPGLTPQQIEYLCREVAASLQAVPQPVPMIPQHNLRLVLRHDCQ